MKAVFQRLSPAEEKLATRITALDLRLRGISINRLGANARIAVTRLILAAESKKTESSHSSETKAAAARALRIKRLRERLQRAIRRRQAFDRATKVILVRRVRAVARLLGA